MIRPQVLHPPAMLRDPAGHRWCRRAPTAAQTRVRGTKVIDRTEQIHPVLERPRAPRPCPPSTCQRGQPCTACGVKPLDVRRDEHPGSVCSTPAPLHAYGRAIHEAALDVNDAPLGIALHDRCEADGTPRPPPGTPVCSPPDWIATGLANRATRGAQAVGAAQERAVGGTAAHPRHEPAHPRHVARRTDRTAEPHAGTDPHRQSHPHHAARPLHADLVGLHVSQVLGWLDHLRLDGLSRLASACPPIRHGPLVEPTGRDESWHWAAMRTPRHHAAHRLGSSPQAVTCRTFRGAARLVTRGAQEALVLARVDAKRPSPVWPLAGHSRLGQNTVAGSMTLLLAWRCWGACQEGVCLDPYVHDKRTSPRLRGELPRVVFSPLLSLHHL